MIISQLLFSFCQKYMKSKPLPPLNALRAFESVSRHVNVTRAADELSVSPSAISHMIRRLEENMGVKLIERSGRNIVLSETGKNFAPELQEIFNSLLRVVNKTRESLNKNIVIVSLRPYFAAKWLAPKLSKFSAEHPEVQLHLHHSNEQVDFLSSNTDFSIEWSDGDRPGVTQYKLVAGELTPVWSPSLSPANEISEAQDLLNFPLLRETDRDSWSQWFKLCNCTLPAKIRSIYIDDSNVRYQAALNGQGIELGCKSLIFDDVAEKKLIAPFDTYIEDMSYYLFQRPESKQSEAANIFKTGY